jgi:hypothetical protein
MIDTGKAILATDPVRRQRGFGGLILGCTFVIE